MVVGGLLAVAVVALTRRKPPILPPAPEVVLSDLVISPAVVAVGEPVTIMVTATNMGDKTEAVTVRCEVS